MSEFGLNGIDIDNEEKLRTGMKTILLENDSNMDKKLNAEIKNIENIESTNRVVGTSFIPEVTEKDGFGLTNVVKYRIIINYEYAESV